MKGTGVNTGLHEEEPEGDKRRVSRRLVKSLSPKKQGEEEEADEATQGDLGLFRQLSKLKARDSRLSV